MAKKYLQAKRLITYSCLFPDKQPINLEEYLQSIPTVGAIEFVTHLNLQRSELLITQDELGLLIPILFRFNQELQRTVTDYLQNIQVEEYSFIDNYSLLLLTEALLTCNNFSEDELSRDDYSNLMLAYWICCEKRVSKVKNVEGIDSPESFLKAYVPEQLIYNDIGYPKDYRTEVVKCFSFMSFSEKDSIFSNYLKIFESEYGLSWQKYLFLNFTMYLRIAANETGITPIVYIDEKNTPALNFLMSICCELGSFTSKTDFRTLKQTPVLKVSRNRYVILFDKFFIDKIFVSLLFDFARILAKHKQITNINGLPDLKRLVGQRFTEHVLFYDIIDRCFQKYADVMLPGETLRAKIINGEPDYYIRKGSRVFVFEFKDVLLNTEVKYSGDWTKIRNELFELFEQSTFEKNTGKSKKSKPKAIKQLLNTIQEKLPIIHDTIDNINLGRIYVFPIIVYTDSNFDIDGVNYVLNDRFSSLLNLTVINSRYVVKDLTMINLNNLIQLEDMFFQKKLNLCACINDFISFKSADSINSVISFNKYLMRKSKVKGFRLAKTKWFNDTLLELKNFSID